MKQDPEESSQFGQTIESVERESSEESRTGANFDVLIPDVFRFPNIEYSEQEQLPLSHEHFLKQPKKGGNVIRRGGKK